MTYTRNPEGTHTLKTDFGTFTADSREKVEHLAMLAERRERQRLALVAKQDRRSTYSSVMRNRRIWG